MYLKWTETPFFHLTKEANYGSVFKMVLDGYYPCYFQQLLVYAEWYYSYFRCGIEEITKLLLSNLRELYLSDNLLTEVDMQDFSHLQNLRVLDLSSNPIVQLISSGSTGILFS